MQRAVKVLRVSRGGLEGYLGAYGKGDEAYLVPSALDAIKYPIGLRWHHEKRLNDAIDYLTDNNYQYTVRILEYEVSDL